MLTEGVRSFAAKMRRTDARLIGDATGAQHEQKTSIVSAS
jgi:hypothetical protein